MVVTLQRNQTSPSTQKYEKDITIAIPTLNEERYVATALDAVVNNGFSVDNITILILDGGSTDNTLNEIETIGDKFPTLLNIITKNGITVYQALKLALELTKTEYFMRVDARSILPSGYIEKCLKNLELKRVVGTGGVQEQFGTTNFGRAVATVTAHPFGILNASFRLGKKSGYVDTVYLGAYRTADLNRVGGYDSDGRFLSEDSSVNSKLREAGGLIYLDAGLRVKYPAKESYADFARQYLIYGAAKASYFLSHGKLTSWRQVLPVIIFATIVFSMILSLFWTEPLFLIAGLALMYLVSNIYFSTRLSLFEKKAGFLDLSIAFSLIHFCWPAGFLIRLLGGEMMLSRILRK